MTLNDYRIRFKHYEQRQAKAKQRREVIAEAGLILILVLSLIIAGFTYPY